jgi:hypothetical protein
MAGEEWDEDHDHVELANIYPQGEMSLENVMAFWKDLADNAPIIEPT